MPQCSRSNYRDAVKASPIGSFQRAGMEDMLDSGPCQKCFLEPAEQNPIAASNEGASVSGSEKRADQ